jgi:hypothetical protein
VPALLWRYLAVSVVPGGRWRESRISHPCQPCKKRYFGLPDAVERGALRPFRDPNAARRGRTPRKSAVTACYRRKLRRWGQDPVMVGLFAVRGLPVNDPMGQDPARTPGSNREVRYFLLEARGEASWSPPSRDGEMLTASRRTGVGGDSNSVHARRGVRALARGHLNHGCSLERSGGNTGKRRCGGACIGQSALARGRPGPRASPPRLDESAEANGCGNRKSRQERRCRKVPEPW